MAGFNLGFGKLIIVFGTFLFWAKLVGWADEDSRSLKVRPEFWSTVLLAGGLASFIGVLCVPSFLLGLLVMLAGSAGTLGFYIVERNEKVPASSRVIDQEASRQFGNPLTRADWYSHWFA